MASGEKKKKGQRWVLPVVGFLLALSLGVSFGPDLLRDWKEKRITESGVQAPAQIIDITDTGNRYNSNPEVELTLEVTPDAGRPFSSTARKVLTPVALQKFVPGASVMVMYDPDDRGEVVIVGLKR
jgi:hypothetical protein